MNAQFTQHVGDCWEHLCRQYISGNEIDGIVSVSYTHLDVYKRQAMYLKNWLGALKEDPKFIYNILADVGKASNMIQEHASRMEQYLTPEERFTLAVLQDNRPVLEQMKNEGFIPSE